MAEYKGKKGGGSSSQNTEAMVVEAIFKGIYDFIVWVINSFKSDGGNSPAKAAERAQIRESWGSVELHLMQSNTHALAVSEADKLLDAGMRVAGVSGTTMGERLKNARGKFPNDLYQEIWDAHKLRNTLAHEVGAQVDGRAYAAVDAFRRGLAHLKVLE